MLQHAFDFLDAEFRGGLVTEPTSGTGYASGWNGPTPIARRTDPATSHAAAAEAHELRARHHAQILECLRAHGPLGKDGIAARTRLTGVAVARRTVELQRLGLIRPTGRTVPSTAGRAEREWEVVAWLAGRAG